MMEKFGQFFGRTLADAVHLKRHSDEFHDSLTPEEREAWKEEMGGVSMWQIFKELMRQKRDKMKQAKAAKKEATKQGIDPAEHPYFVAELKSIKESGLVDENREYSDKDLKEVKEILKDLGVKMEETEGET